MLVTQRRGRVYCCASAGSPEPRQARSELVKIYDVDEHLSSFPTLHEERGEADHGHV